MPPRIVLVSLPVACIARAGTVNCVDKPERREVATYGPPRDGGDTLTGSQAVTQHLRALGKADPLRALELLIASLPPLETSRDVYRAS
jgi:hypothetical protein